MKRHLYLLALVVAAVYLRNWVATPERTEAFFKRISLPYRIAALGTKPADEALDMPVKGVRITRVADTWNAPRSGGRAHQGQDIFAPLGTPVVSATEGIVVRIGQNNLGGNVVVVTGPGFRSYYYAHLNSFAEQLEIGDTVQRGTVLGYVGKTGNARTTPPHLHFGVYTASGAMNPMPLLERGAGHETGAEEPVSKKDKQRRGAPAPTERRAS